MTQAASRLSLQDFLALPETRPASEYINGKIIQKPMPKGKHSRLQLQLCNTINAKAEPAQIAYAFPELRCSFGNRSVVPDIAVFKWSRIVFDEADEPANDFFICPDWVVEILSPDQRPNRVADNILYCIEHGCQLGWLTDPADRSVMVYVPGQLPIFYEGDSILPTLESLDFSLSAEDLFSLLKMNR
ncbi:MAG: Uma2 family endonuclease [Leptolyngbya sp. SIO4C1]|nr:Uma2 family endonuclease [Leptolyngbya sp. SIO4C1]